MSNTTQKPQSISLNNVTQRELEERLKKARAKNRKLKSEGKSLPNVTKSWSKKSIESLSAALSGKR